MLARRIRASFASASLLLAAFAFSVYACDNGTFDNNLNVFQPYDGGTQASIGEDAGSDASAPVDGGGADVVVPAKDASSDAGDAGTVDAAAPADSGDAGSELDAADTADAAG